MHLNTSGVLFKPFTKGTVEIPKEPMTKHQLPGKLIEGIDNGVEKEGGKCTNAFQAFLNVQASPRLLSLEVRVRKCRIAS